MINNNTIYMEKVKKKIKIILITGFIIFKYLENRKTNDYLKKGVYF